MSPGRRALLASLLLCLCLLQLQLEPCLSESVENKPVEPLTSNDGTVAELAKVNPAQVKQPPAQATRSKPDPPAEAKAPEAKAKSNAQAETSEKSASTTVAEAEKQKEHSKADAVVEVEAVPVPVSGHGSQGGGDGGEVELLYGNEEFKMDELEEVENEEEALKRPSDSEEMESGFHMDEFHPSHVYTFPVAAGKEECLYVDIFEGIPARIKGAYFVSSGGSMQISFALAVDVDGSPMQLLEKPGKSEDTFALVVARAGEYSFCFTNPSHGYGEKIVTLAVHVVRNIEEGLVSKGYAKAHHVVSLKTTVKDIYRTVLELEAEQKFLKERTTRHMMTQDSTEWRVAWYTVFESTFMFAIAFGQVWYVQRLINQRVWV